MRLTIGHLAIFVGITAIALGAIVASDSFWLLFAAYLISLIGPTGRYTRRWLPAAIVLAVVSSAVSPGDTFTGVIVAFVGFGLCLAATFTIPRRPDGRRDRRFVTLAVASLLVIASVAATSWPLRVAFAYSRSNFETLTRRLESGEHVAGPIRVGAYHVERAELDAGRACLWTDTNPAGRAGFVRNPGPRSKPAKGPLLTNGAFNLWSYTGLDRDWAFISED